MCGPEATGVKIDPVGKLSDQSVIKTKIRKVGRFWPPPERHHFGTQRSRCLVFFEIRNFFEEVQNFFEIQNSGRFVDFGRRRDGIISAARMAGVSCFLKIPFFGKSNFLFFFFFLIFFSDFGFKKWSKKIEI